MTVSEEELNKALKPHLDTIIENKVRMSRVEAERNIKIVESVVDLLVEAMRAEDDLFDELFQRIVYTGSYYEKLRVKSADEFDLNIVLGLPFNYMNLTLSWCPHDQAYVQYQLRQDPETHLKEHQKNKPPLTKLYAGKRKFFDEQNFLQQDQIRQWIQSIISKVMQPGGRFKPPPEVSLKKTTTSGPAFTYHLKTSEGKIIDVDLVPVIDIPAYVRPDGGLNPGERYHKHHLSLNLVNNWFLVPKPFKEPANKNNSEEVIPSRYWRMAMPEAEKALLKDTGCLRMLIKLFKLLRDCHEYWRSPLPSYFIKTFFLWEYEEKDKDAWNVDDLGKLFLQMLEKLRIAILKRNIPYYFNRERNLLSTMSFDTSYNITNRIERIINKIKQNVDSILEVYGLPLQKAHDVKWHFEVTSVQPVAPSAYPTTIGVNPIPTDYQREKEKEESKWWCVIL